MRPTILFGISAMALSTALWLPVRLIAQDDAHKGAHHRYKLIDLGTFGGPHSYGSTNGDGSRMLNNAGVVTSFADTATPDPNAPDHCFVPDCLVAHAFRWRHGRLRDLGALDDSNSSIGAGEIAGSANLPSPGIHDAVIWRHGRIKDLGTVAGDPCSNARAINSWGQVVGGSSDCRNFLHAFVWEKGGPMRDLNRLIAPGSGLQLTNAFNINDRGEILAKSFPIGTTPNDDADLGHIVLLIPCEAEDHEGGCSDADRKDDAAPEPSDSAPATARATAVPHSQYSLTEEDDASAWRGSLARRLGTTGVPRK